jgi:membrane fusion protein (multidrug efflux system)
MGAVVLVLILLIGGIKGCGVFQMMQGMSSMPEQKATVTAIKAPIEEWQISQGAVGSLRAVQGADLSSELAGVVEAVRFQPGTDVKAGDLLVQLRADSDVATLRSLEAQATLAKTNYERAKLQIEAHMISKADFDAATANLRDKQAQAQAQAALVAKKGVRAPFDGHVGINLVNPGQYVNPGDKLVTLQTLDPIYVDFFLPQQALSQLAKGQKVIATLDAFPGKEFSGEITAIDPKVNTDTRNVQVQATLQNPERKLLPGMFANIGIAVGEPQRYVTLPQTAVEFNPYGETVYLVVPRGQENQPDPNAPAAAQSQQAPAADSGAKPAEKPAAPAADVLVARQVFVTTGATRGDQVAILKGVREGDEVVTSGQLKLRNGMAVTVDNKVTPSNDPNPKPIDQ